MKRYPRPHQDHLNIHLFIFQLSVLQFLLHYLHKSAFIAMADVDYTAKLLNLYRISPPAGSVPTTLLPLSFLDFIWMICRPMRRLFFFQFPHSTNHFMDSVFPTLKRSLSLSLQHFFPLAGNLILPPQPHKPHILYTPHDSVPLTVAESTGGDFTTLIADYPRDAKHFYPFVPDMPESRLLPDGSRAIPNFAIQITIFPNQGLCICIAFQHVVADGIAIHHFIKSWASISRNGGTSDSFEGPLPCHNRAAIKDVKGLESIFLQELSSWDSLWNPVPYKPIIDQAPVDRVRTTLVLTRPMIEKLKTWVSAESNNDEELKPLRLSSFIVTCSLVWGCLIKSTQSEASDSEDEDELCYFGFLADCRNRVKDPLPPTYFGNCLDVGVVELKKSELVKRNSIVMAAKAIGNRVEEFENEPLKVAEKWFSLWKTYSKDKHFVTIAGSPKLKAYDTDFGWGRAMKSEVLHVDNSESISLQDSRDEQGGIEIGLGLHNTQMDRFMAIWEQNLKDLCS
ncbi:coumaroyl-CoA:anthocyanidin 3-O-glucoside-6''-O-coumaroyltransferase 1-like [Cucurbita pepo subsp. pepo]|uniref:coumaroyl-CoA:anthocyanidin 3-O-glucoside-6''-O-coumaroyltransferase 1-like n=1 Tax=Cucurbita pepo subsp. pepo TaxID=3664 RepID=UPI000C9D3E2F|nr:coumaroyl-CoA:anthocyanidin 3-O-glucoside-6''-O-coumaroyltransferase 1-like [Cucurbita pepo subsp. pepo]